MISGSERQAAREQPVASGRARLQDGGGGLSGNERLTAASGALLLPLLAAEGVTILFIGSLLTAHVFIGMLLIGPVVLKLGSTGYRFLRYYAGNRVYRAKGPPPVALRLIGPAVVGSTLGVFATGVALLLAGPGNGFLLTLHKASFIAWLAVTAIHVLAHIWEVPGLTVADWRAPRPPAVKLPGSLARRLLLAAALVGGLVLALATLPLAHPWLAHLGEL